MSPPDSIRDGAQDDFLFHLYRGSELLQENRILEAKEELEHALTVQPLDAKGQDLLGAVYFRLGLYPRAIQIYEGLQAQFPVDVSIRINLALCYLKTGQPEPARRVLREVVEINPDHKRAWGYLGLALQKLGELEQAQIAFEKGDRPTMARRVTEFRRSLFPPLDAEPRSTSIFVQPPVPEAPPSEVTRGLQAMADTAFSELDTGELQFALAQSADRPLTDVSWHTLEMGDPEPPRSRNPPRSTFTKTLPPPWMGELEPGRDGGSQPPPSIPLSAPPALRVPRIVEPLPTPAETPPPPSADAWEGRRSRAAPAILSWRSAASVERHPSGAVLVRTRSPDGAFAGRTDAIRVVAGSVTARVLHRRTRDTETDEVMGDPPLVRVAGDAQLVLGARPGRRLAFLAVADELAFVREDLLAGFELSLTYENGRVVLEHGARDPVPIVQLRGLGSFLLDVPGALGSLPSRPGQPLLVQREWIVGWFGRLLTRALLPAEAPGGRAGLVGFWGEGTVLVCFG